MLGIHTKNHDGWNTKKKHLDGQTPRVFFHKREVWFCSIGHNIGAEEDGKGSEYARPVVIIRRFGAGLFIGIPLTSQVRIEKYFFGVGSVNGRAAMAILTQIRLFSSKRLINKIGNISPPVFVAMKKAAKSFIF